MHKTTLPLVILIASWLAAPGPAFAQTPAAAQDEASLPLYAVQIRTGEKWDPAKPAQQQPFFKEHSANLKRLRDAGHLVIGARYSDIGLVVLAAESEASAKAMMDEDPSFKAGTFRYELHPFHVFYAGAVSVRPRSAEPK